MRRQQTTVVMLLLTWASIGTVTYGQQASTWWQGYRDAEANGPHVLGYWKFDDQNAFPRDTSSHKHQATRRGAVWHAEGRFGGALESSAGHPVTDKSHGLHVKASAELSPAAAFTLEMWVRPKDEKAFPKKARPVLIDMKYVPYNHTGLMWSLTNESGDGKRQMVVDIGLGARSERWYSRPFALPSNRWRHVAFSYDGAGTVTFSVDGGRVGRVTKSGAGSMARATRWLSIGDRLGSLYNGFPGFIDEVRMTTGIRDFRPIRIAFKADTVFVRRMAEQAKVRAELFNQTGMKLDSGMISALLPGNLSRKIAMPPLVPGGSHTVEFGLDSSLKPGRYEISITASINTWPQSDSGYAVTAITPQVVLPRELPHRMPVVMWGVGGTDNVIKEIPRLKDIGFTHCLGLSVDYNRIWKDGAKALPGTADAIRNGRKMLHVALQNDLKIVATLSPGSWLRRAEQGRSFRRIDRRGNHYGREDVSGLFPAVQEYCFNVGAAMSRAYGDHPAFDAALLHTEVRGESQLSFHPLEIAAYKRATGLPVPAAVNNKNGIDYRKLESFPKDRVIADNDPILQYYRWFWTRGDGWNGLNTKLHNGLTSKTRSSRLDLL